MAKKPYWHKTGYRGLWYVINRQGLRVYYARFSRGGKKTTERLGTSGPPENLTPATANGKRQALIEGRELTRTEKAERDRQRKAERDARKTFNTIWRLYKHFKPDLKGMTTDDNRYKKHIKPEFGNRCPIELTHADLDGFKLRLQKSALKPGTVKNILELFRRICNYAVKKGHCDPLPYRIEVPVPDNQTTEDLTPEQRKRLIEECDKDSHPQAGALMLCALFTGMRRSELFRLKWSDLDFDRQLITLRDTKSGKSHTIPMNDIAKDLFKRHRQRAELRQTEKKPPKWCFSEFVFSGRSGAQRTDIHKHVNRIRDAAGLPKTFRALHGMRHSYASFLASSGEVDLYTISKLLTHSSTVMTQRYAHLHDQALRRASNVAAGMLPSEPEK